MAKVVKTQKTYKEISEIFIFDHFPDFEKIIPKKHGDMYVEYKDIPIGCYYSIPLKSYYAAMCNNPENSNRIRKIKIVYQTEIVIESPEQKSKAKSLF